LRARERGYDAMSDGLADAERIAEREHDVADLQLVGIAELDRREALPAVFDAQYRQVGARVLQHDLGLELALVGERDLHLARTLDHVFFGLNQAAGIDDPARAERALHLFLRQATA